MLDPRQFTPAAVPERTPCSACGSAWSHHRERRGGGRRLCRQCFARAAERERRRCPPLPAVIDPAMLKRATAEIGRCDVCALEPAAWSGGRVRLCDACYRREIRRRIARGDAQAPA